MTHALALPARLFGRGPRVNLVRLQGMIAAQARGRLSDAEIAPVLERAFRAGKPKAVALLINSPGGSPVQSSLIAARIRRLADETGVPVHAFVEDAAASGGYWLATAADDIHADACSILGSIGVIFAGFGLNELIGRHGIERRVHTAGRSKSQLDPFRPENPEDVERLNRLLEQMHDAFIAQVRDRRGDKLATDAELFDGRFWLGQEAVRLGLADGLGHAVPVLKARYGDKVRLVPYTLKRPFLARFGMALTQDALAAAEERALWSRLGV
ncbi:MAG: serine protease SohB [Rhodobacteraceae bacterium HLUCCA12]|nr:MAG: serine protease SohB [Rhodobacteraceae bacterium HLUCCA12]